VGLARATFPGALPGVGLACAQLGILAMLVWVLVEARISTEINLAALISPSPLIFYI